MISGYELLTLNLQMGELIQEKEDLQMYMHFSADDIFETETNELQQRLEDLDFEIIDTMKEIEACGGTYEFDQ